MRLCIFLCTSFEDTFENAQWRKVEQMHPEQGGNRYNAKMAYQHQPPLGPQLGPQSSAPAALQLQASQAPSLADIENSLAHMQLQYAALANQLSSQQEQLEQQKTPGAPGSAHGAPLRVIV